MCFRTTNSFTSQLGVLLKTKPPRFLLAECSKNLRREDQGVSGWMAEEEAGIFWGTMTVRYWWCCYEVRVGRSHMLKLRNIPQLNQTVNMQRKWYHTPFQDSVIVPKLFPDTLSISPNKLPCMSLLVGTDKQCTTWKKFFYF